MKRWILAIFCGVGAMLFVVVLAALGASNNRAKSDMTVAEILENMATAADEMKGREIAPNVVISGASVEDGTRLTYYYRILQLAKIDYELGHKLSLKMKREVCGDRTIRRALDGGAEILYLYRSNNGRVVFTVEINKDVCSRLT